MRCGKEIGDDWDGGAARELIREAAPMKLEGDSDGEMHGRFRSMVSMAEAAMAMAAAGS